MSEGEKEPWQEAQEWFDGLSEDTKIFLVHLIFTSSLTGAFLAAALCAIGLSPAWILIPIAALIIAKWVIK